MSARYTPKDIHPSIFDEVLSVTGGHMNGTLTDQRQIAAANKHSNVWMAEYWKSSIGLAVGLIVVVGGAVLLKHRVPEVVLVMYIMGGILGIVGSAMFLMQRNKKLLTWGELDALLPGLNLSESQKLYVDCLQCIEESNILDANQKESWRDALYNGLDQAITLEKLAKSMQESSGGKDHIESLAEIARLEDLASKASDEVARHAYQESLALARERMSKWDHVAAQAERTEAHLELTRQTFLKTRDTLKSMNLQQQRSVYVDLEPLRANLGRIQTDAFEIQRAIEELREI